MDFVVECNGIRTQDLAKNLLDLGVFKIWTHDGKTYARCSAENMDSLNALTKKLIGLKIGFSYVKIQFRDPNAERKEQANDGQG